MPNAISVGPSSSSPRWLTRAGRVGPGVLLVEDHLLAQASARGRRTPSASRRRSSRARRGAGPTRAARRTPRARGPGRRGRAARRTRRSRCSSSQARTSARKASSSADVGQVHAVGSLPSTCLVGRRSGCRVHRARSRRAPRRRGAVRRPPGVRRGRPHRCPSPTCSTRVRETAARLRRARARARRPGRGLGARTASTGWSRARRVVRRRRARAGQLAATPATRSPTSSTAPAPTLVVVADGFLGRTQSPTCAPPATCRRCARSSTSPTSTRSTAAAPTRPTSRGARRRGRPRRRRRHPVHLRHHRPAEGRDERAPADHRRRATPGPSSAGSRPDDRYLVVNPFFHSFGYKIGIVVGLLTGATLYPVATFDVDATMRLIEDERITVLPGRADDLPVAARRARPRRATTCPRCGSRSPARPSCRSC